MRRRTFLSATLAAVSVALSTASFALRAAVAQISGLRLRPRAMILPPLPKWNKATDDIDTHDFAQRCRDYERSLLPRNIILPATGQVWEAVCDCEVPFQAWCTGAVGSAWLAQAVTPLRTTTPSLFPFGIARLHQGERVCIRTVDDDQRPLWVTFVPVRYHELLDGIVPTHLRAALTHYEFNLKTARTVCVSRDQTRYFNELFRLVKAA